MSRTLTQFLLALAASLLTLLSVALWPVPAAAAVNINSADATTISRGLKGIGLKRAQAIVDYRRQHGPFRTVDDLALVKGIGPKAIERNRADIRLDGGTSGAARAPARAAGGTPAGSPAREPSRPAVPR
ncbi:MAG: hypothetical protein RL026_2652 [Pseudomonadota bacterium]|jgi:competence protein ComEA